MITRGEGVYVYDDAAATGVVRFGPWEHLARFQRKMACRGGRAPDGEAADLSHLQRPFDRADGRIGGRCCRRSFPRLGKVLSAESPVRKQTTRPRRSSGSLQQCDRPSRKKKIIGRVRAYHGITVFAGSMTGSAAEPPILTRRSVACSGADCPSHYLFGLPGERAAGLHDRLVGNLEQMIVREGPTPSPPSSQNR